jgi:hypothetical protein
MSIRCFAASSDTDGTAGAFGIKLTVEMHWFTTFRKICESLLLATEGVRRRTLSVGGHDEHSRQRLVIKRVILDARPEVMCRLSPREIKEEPVGGPQ